jgi:hypothetical protein
MAQTDLELLTYCAEFTLAHSASSEKQVLEELQTSGATRLVMALRMLRLQRAILAVGIFSLFEALLRSRVDWNNPFNDLDAYLRREGKPDLASAINDYKLAISVLKHGEGRSHKELLERKECLDFKIRGTDDPFFDEGDVSEVDILIDVDDHFVKRCADLIQQAHTLVVLHVETT